MAESSGGDGKHGVFRIGNGLPLAGDTHQPLATLGERHDRRRGAAALGVGDNLRLAAFHHRHARVSGSQVYSYYFAHFSDSFLLYFFGIHSYVLSL